MTKTTSTPLWLVAAPDWLDPKWGGPNVTVMPAALGEQLKRERQQAQHERDVAIERVAPLLDALKEAREMVASWGAYVSAYFREKHDLAGNLKWLDDTIALAPGGSQTQPNTAVGESGTAAASLDVIVQHARDAVAEAQEDDGVVTIKAEMLSLLLEGLERLKTERHEFYLEQLRLLERQPVEPTAPLPEMMEVSPCSYGSVLICKACGEMYSSPPWVVSAAAEDHRGKCKAVNRVR